MKIKFIRVETASLGRSIPSMWDGIRQTEIV
jgi:hypothetical protein